VHTGIGVSFVKELPGGRAEASRFQRQRWCHWRASILEIEQYLFGAPKNTPASVVETLNKEISAGLADPRLKQRIAELGSTVFVNSPEEFRKFIANYTEKWAKVIRAAGIHAG
jgi:hypothetical protein